MSADAEWAGYLDGVAYLDALSYEAEDPELARLLSTRGWHVYGERNLVADALPLWREVELVADDVEAEWLWLADQPAMDEGVASLYRELCGDFGINPLAAGSRNQGVLGIARRWAGLGIRAREP